MLCVLYLLGLCIIPALKISSFLSGMDPIASNLKYIVFYAIDFSTCFVQEKFAFLYWKSMLGFFFFNIYNIICLSFLWSYFWVHGKIFSSQKCMMVQMWILYLFFYSLIIIHCLTSSTSWSDIALCRVSFMSRVCVCLHAHAQLFNVQRVQCRFFQPL